MVTDHVVAQTMVVLVWLLPRSARLILIAREPFVYYDSKLQLFRSGLESRTSRFFGKGSSGSSSHQGPRSDSPLALAQVAVDTSLTSFQTRTILSTWFQKL